MHLRKCTWDPMLDLSIGQQIGASSKVVGVSSIPDRRVHNERRVGAGSYKAKGKA